MTLSRIGLLLSIALLGGCSGESRRDGFVKTIPDWQRGTILGGAQPDPVATTIRPVDGPIGSWDSTSTSVVFDGGPAIAAPFPGVTYLANGDVTLDLRDVPARDAAMAVLGDVLKVPYVISDQVEGRVTLRTQGALRPQAVLRLLEAALRPVGAVVIVRDRVHHVLPAGENLPPGANSIVPAPRESVAGFASRAVQMRYIPAAEMAEILKPLMKEDAGLRVDAARNVLVLSGTGAEHEALMETIRTFDVDWLANRSVAVFRINGMTAEAMVKGLNEILHGENLDRQIVRFLPLESGNAVLAVAKTPEALRAARQWVQRLEAAGGRRSQLYSYQMKYAQAKQVLPILTRLFGAEGGVQGEGGSDVSSASATGAASASARRERGRGAGRQDRTAGMGEFGTPGGGMQGSFEASNATSAAGANSPIGAGMSSATGGPTPETGVALRLMVNEPTNTLLIYATDAEYRKVRNVLRTLDVPPRQVLVEATIVEVGLTNDLRHGVQYYLSSRIKGMPIDAVLTNGNFNQITPQQPGFGLTLNAPAKVVIDALSEVTRLNVISAPNVMVVNNQSARLVVGDQVPIATQSRQDPLQDNQVVVNTIELRDTGVIFEVTPRISSSGSVLLDIVQEVSSIKPQSDPTLTPTVSQRKLSSSVTVEHGETIVLGGLFSTQSGSGTTGLPFLSQVPILGNAFGRGTRETARTELIVLITPKIVNDRQGARQVTREIRDRLSELKSEDPSLVRRDTLSEWMVDVKR